MVENQFDKEHVMDSERFLEILDSARQFFVAYKEAHKKRIIRFDKARAITREISKEVTGIELKIIEQIIDRLVLMRGIDNPTSEHCKVIAEYLNEANECLLLQKRNVDLACNIVPVPAHQVGVDEADKLVKTLDELRALPELNEYADQQDVTWHSQRHANGIDFTYLILIPYLMKTQSPHANQLLAALKKEFAEHQNINKVVHEAAANDDFHAYPPSFVPAFKALEKDKDYTAEQVLDALKVVEDLIPKAKPVM